MLKEKLKNLFSFNGISLLIGILGSLASILTMFISKWDSQISLKWIVFVIFISLTVVIILIKLLFDLVCEIKKEQINIVKAVRYIPENKTLLVEKNNILGYYAMVSIFYLDENYEVELGKGFVKNIQEKFSQIQVLEFSQEFIRDYQESLMKIESNEIRTLQKIIVKSYISYTK